jgi:hypothetical protein
VGKLLQVSRVAERGKPRSDPWNPSLYSVLRISGGRMSTTDLFTKYSLNFFKLTVKVISQITCALFYFVVSILRSPTSKSTPSKKMPNCHCERNEVKRSRSVSQTSNRKDSAITSFCFSTRRYRERDLRNDRLWIIYLLEHSKRVFINKICHSEERRIYGLKLRSA